MADVQFFKLPVGIAERRDLESSDKVVFAVILDKIGDNGFCWPGVRTIAEKSGLTVPTVIKSVRRLEASGVLTAERHGPGKSTHYSIVESAQETLAVKKKKKRSRDFSTSAKETCAQALKRLALIQTDSFRQTPRRAQPNPKAPVDDSSFNRFWDAYPRKVARAAADRAWHKLKPGPELVSTILAAVKRQQQTEQWRKNAGRFIPYAATWLTGERWKDELLEPQRGDADWLPSEEEIAALEREGIL